MRRLIAVALVALAQPAAAQSIAIPFAPPVDRPLVYRIEQHRPVEGATRRFSATRDLRFEKAGDGYSLAATLRDIDSDAPPAGSEPYRAALGPMVGLTLRFRLNGQGRIIGLDDQDAAWGVVQAGVDAMLATFAPDTPRHKAAAKVQALFASLSPEGRLALLAGEIQPLFLFAGSGVEGGEGRGLRTVAGSPLGRPVPVEGTLRVVGQSTQGVDLAEKLAGEGVQVGIDYHLSRITGLVETQRRSLALGSLALTEIRTLTPAP
ncbi:hypothetical protein U5A82_08075 [Sphingobium sp. CR2-8]|uniref:hypothetical protein n=1 Tax=Sphingobium sp. CR2-8 TaxID=1306534 RepID=UPI002DBEF2B7|nr:hypothetical protein [Sphingobium sp. CR2-8]MEC3910438.1 hypothetical protein [Sphingobium sp. CR2-8]